MLEMLEDWLADVSKVASSSALCDRIGYKVGSGVSGERAGGMGEVRIGTVVS